MSKCDLVDDKTFLKQKCKGVEVYDNEELEQLIKKSKQKPSVFVNKYGKLLNNIQEIVGQYGMLSLI